MIAYLTRVRGGYVLAVCERPCNGAEYALAPRHHFTTMKEVRAYCAANSIKPWNF